MQKNHRKDLLVIIILFIISILLQLHFLNPPILTDQMEYYFTAIHIPHLPSNPNIGSMRIGLELPVAVLYRIFGSSEIAYYTFPLLSFSLLVISVYLIGKGLFSRRVGIFSALWIMTIPNLILEFGHLLPDIPATALASAGFAVLITAFGNKENKPDYCSRKSKLIFILAGFLFGWSYLVKEYLAILFFIIPLVFWILDIPMRHIIPVALAMLFMYGIEVAVGIIYYQNPLIRFGAASPRETLGEIQKDVNKIITYFAILLNKQGGQAILVVMLLGVVNSIISSIKKKKSQLFLLSWVLLIYGLFTFAGLLPVIFKWDGIVLMRLHKFRYWIPILPPLVIGGVVVIENLVRVLLEKISDKGKVNINILTALLALALVAVSAHGILTIKDDPGFIANGYDHYLELRQYLKEHDEGSENEVIWIDRDNKRAFERILPMYVRDVFGKRIWHGSFKYINTDNLYLRAEEIDIGYIIIDRDFMIPETYGVPDYLADPPANWTLAFESENKKLALYAVE